GFVSRPRLGRPKTRQRRFRKSFAPTSRLWVETGEAPRHLPGHAACHSDCGSPRFSWRRPGSFRRSSTRGSSRRQSDFVDLADGSFLSPDSCGGSLMGCRQAPFCRLVVGRGNPGLPRIALFAGADECPLARLDNADWRVALSDRLGPGGDEAAMTARHETIEVRTRGKETYEITEQVAAAVGKSGIRTGIVSIFIRHTSASLVIYENADSSARA